MAMSFLFSVFVASTQALYSRTKAKHLISQTRAEQKAHRLIVQNDHMIERLQAKFSSPSSSTIGPVLPPELILHASDDSDLDEDEEQSGVSIGPTLPKTLSKEDSSDDDGCYGPRLPSGISTKDDDDDSYGPKLPTSMSKSKKHDDDDGNLYGPRIPGSSSRNHPPTPKDDEDASYGPVLPKISSIDDDSDDDSYGPALPKNLSTSSTKLDKNRVQDDDDDDDSYGPALPKNLSTSSSSKMDKNRVLKDDDDDDSYGPSLPPSVAGGVKGPSLPPVPHGQDADDDDDDYGPALPPGLQDQPAVKGPSLPPDEDEEVIGPLPWMMHTGTDGGQSAAEEFESSARAMKDKLTGKNEDQAPQRESWMMELPGYSKNFGLGPRQFRKRNVDMGDRSVWTDTPADKARKEKELREGKGKAKKAKPSEEEVTLSERDKHLAEQISGYNQSKRAELLMDMHSKDRKEKLLAEGTKPKERRAFDREQDLQVNRFDEARKKNMMKKAGQLGDRFSHSKGKMFL